MTTVPEVVLAKEAGMCFISIAMATDYDCWRESEKSVCVTDVLEMFKKNIDKVTKLLIAIVPMIAKAEWTDTINELKVYLFVLLILGYCQLFYNSSKLIKPLSMAFAQISVFVLNFFINFVYFSVV